MRFRFGTGVWSGSIRLASLPGPDCQRSSVISEIMSNNIDYLFQSENRIRLRVERSRTSPVGGAWNVWGLPRSECDQAGNLYGTTVRGGKVGSCGGPGCGVVFKLAPNSKGGWSETVLHRFLDHRGTGAYPSASLIFDATGNLYGTTAGDLKKTHGSVFEILP